MVVCIHQYLYKKLSYRRETARQLRASFRAGSMIVHFTNTASVVQLYNRLAEVVSTLSANKPCDVRGR